MRGLLKSLLRRDDPRFDPSWLEEWRRLREHVDRELEPRCGIVARVIPLLETELGDIRRFLAHEAGEDEAEDHLLNALGALQYAITRLEDLM